ncbi:MAG: hypothetical protein HYR85_00740 [Planctomycetes bacterium]|nr:hypothetical protein [Planctomycetota bacterium]MBI3847488.1 hypothetical protein [Planctomycetota bacterium]
MRMISMRAFGSTCRTALGAGLVVALASCGGGGGGGSSGGGSLDVVGVSAEGIGLLPQDGLFLNQRFVFTFTSDIDPTSVTPEVFRIRQGPLFTVQARGDFRVSGNQVTFIPTLPTKVDLSDAGLAPGLTYRIQVQGFPNGQALLNQRGRPLTSTFTTTFSTRSTAPLLRDLVPGMPRVVGVLVDVNGDGQLDGDGLCEAQRQPEQFLDRNAPEFRSCAGRSDLFDLRAVPFLSNVRVGAVSDPLVIGLIFSEPVLPATVTQDDEDLNGDGFPDGDGQPDNFILSDLTNRVDTDGNGVPDAARRIPISLDFQQEFQANFGTSGRYFVVAKLKTAFTIAGNSQINIQAVSAIRDFAGNSLVPFSVTFQTGSTPPTDDQFFEPFDDLKNFDPSSTAEWNTNHSGFLQSGRGLGGSGSDGAFTGREAAFCTQPDPNNPNAWTCTLDTNKNQGIYNFTSVTIPAGTTVIGSGGPPLRIKSIGPVSIAGLLRVNGGDGLTGQGNNNAIRQGGAAGPGGFRGGSSRAPANPLDCNSLTPCFADMGMGQGGGGGGRRANSSSGLAGGGGCGSYGQRGSDATGGMGAAGSPGAIYGNPAIDPFIGGSGGGAGGNKPGNVQFPLDSSGGSGGGGGGAVVIESGENVTIAATGSITANGGVGGLGFFQAGTAPPASAGGGGGSGGAIKIQARIIDPIGSAGLAAVGSAGGMGNANEGDGGTGGTGRIRLEDLDGSVTANSAILPMPSIAMLDPVVFSKSLALSKFLDTNVLSARYAFDATDPATGRLLLQSDGTQVPTVTDIHLGAPVDPRVTVLIRFRGARAKATNPNEVDPATIIPSIDENDPSNSQPPLADIRALDGFQFILFQVDFVSTAALTDVPRPIINDLRIRFQYP